MASFNKVILLGNLTRDPELRYTNSGTAVCEFGLAVNRRFGGDAGRDEVCFVDIIVWDKQAESTGRILQKGSPALIEGRLQLDQWEDRETRQKRSRLRVVAERVQFVGGRSDRDEIDGGDVPQQQQYAPRQQPQQQRGGGYQQAPPQQRSGYQQQQPPQQPQQQRGGYQQAPPPQSRDSYQEPPMPDAFDVSNADSTEDDIPF
jgi:single-strand DNA-binding protein